ncbi:hypothetical protein JCM30566_18310 [Marinitoga arctica]
MIIRIDEDFINGLIDKLIEENTNINGLKNINIEMKDNNMHFQVEVDIFGRNIVFDSIVNFKNKPESLAEGILSFALSGDEGIRKIVEGIFFIISEFINGISSKDNEVKIDFSQIKYPEKIKPILKSLKLETFEIKEKEFILKLNYRE